MYVTLILTVQMAEFFMIDPTSYYAPYGYRLEQEQSTSYLPVQEQYIPVVTGFIQPIGTIVMSTYDTGSTDPYCSNLNMSEPYRILLQQQEAALPNTVIIRQIIGVPTLRTDSSNTGFASGTSSEPTLSSELPLPVAQVSQATPLSPVPGPSTRPDPQEVHVAPSPVSSCTHPRKQYVMWMYGGVEV
jgi:hypothetical protein